MHDARNRSIAPYLSNFVLTFKIDVGSVAAMGDAERCVVRRIWWPCVGAAR